MKRKYPKYRQGRTPLIRFLDLISITDNCWEWQGTKVSGYGTFSLKGRKVYAHQFSFWTFNGDIPIGMGVMHTCDNRGCVNPTHLKAGTHTDNMQDMLQKNRQRKKETYFKGENHCNAKLTNKQAQEIRKLYQKRGNYCIRYLAKLYNISNTVINNIIKNQSYIIV